MRLRRLITHNDAHLSDFDNSNCNHTAMVFVGTIRNGTNKLMPTHFLKGGWHYRCDILSLEGCPVVKISAETPDRAKKKDPFYFPVASLKSWQEFNAEDKAEEEAFYEQHAPKDEPAKKKVA
jgi:hypothetical protein